MKRNWKLLVTVSALALIHLVVLGASFFAPYDPAAQNRDFPFAPPMRVHCFDSQGKYHLRPFVYGLTYSAENVGPLTYQVKRAQILPLRFLVRGENAEGKGVFPTRWHLFGVESPARVFLLGTDEFGRDQFSRFLYGGQISLFAGLLAAALSLALALLLGGISGYYGSRLDDLIMRGAEIFMALPWIYLLFAVRAFLPLQLSAGSSFFLLIGVIGLTGWARPARLIRGVVLSEKQRDYVQAARGFGASDFYILRRHVLPGASSVALTQAALLVPQYILAEVTLSFLGLGVGEPVPSWGNMLASLQRYYVLESYGWMFAPALALIPIAMLYYGCANSLQASLKRSER